MNFLECIKEFRKHGDTSNNNVHYSMEYLNPVYGKNTSEWKLAFSTEFDDFEQMFEDCEKGKRLSLSDLITFDWRICTYETKECCSHFCEKCTGVSTSFINR